MDYRALIAESWKYTQSHKKLIRWFGFLPAFFTTTVAIGYIVYQFFAFKESALFNEEEGSSFAYEVFEYAWTFIQNHLSWTLPLVIVAVFFALMYFLFPTLAKAAAIQAIAREKNGQKSGVGIGFRYGIMSFLKLFEYHLLIKTFSFFSIMLEMALVLRFSPNLFKLLFPVFLVFIVIGFILTLLFIYTDFYIVVDEEDVFVGMKKSAKLVIQHWKHTFLVTILMLIIGIRIVIQVLLVFLIPTIIILLTGYIATVALPVTGVVVGGIAGLVMLFIAAYLNGVVDVFSYTVWTFTFLKLTSEKEMTARDNAIEGLGEA